MRLGNYEILNPSGYAPALEELLKMPKLAIDVETSGLSWKNDKFESIAFTDENMRSYEMAPLTDKDHELCSDLLHRFFGDYKGISIYHNAKFDLHMIREYIKEKPKFFWESLIADTMIMVTLNNENQRCSLEKLKMDVLKWEPYTLDNKQMKNIQDTMATMEMYNRLRGEIGRNYNQLFVNEMRLIKCLIDVEYHGIYIDVPYFIQLQADSERKLLSLRHSFDRWWGKEFNPQASSDIAEVMRTMGYGDRIQVTKKDNDAIANWVLTDIHDDKLDSLVEYRQTAKLLSTYIGNYLDAQVDGLIHTEFNQISRTKDMGIATGRLSSSTPNLQNVPKAASDIIRRGFITNGIPIYYFDYSNIEYRLLTHYSAEQFLVEEYLAGGDMHTATATKFGITRDRAKTFNFALAYGAGAKKVSNILDIPEPEALEVITEYKKAYPALTSTINKVTREVRSRGFITNIYGRRRRLVYNECYKAFNSLVQGTAADIMKYGMVGTWLATRDTDVSILLTIHDELAIEIPDDAYVPIVKGIMEQEGIKKELLVPTPVDVKKSITNWNEGVKI